MEELLAYFESLLNYAQDNAGNLNQASQLALAQLISQFQEFIVENQEQEEQREESEIPGNLQEQIHPDLQLLWILSGQQEQAFISYLRTFPSQITQELLNNPTRLSQVIGQLNQLMPEGQPAFINGIQHSDLNSSNIWGTAYDQKTGKMKVRFQGGSEYEYDGIPENIYRAFTRGNAFARTKGKNQYGQWWIGKNPSLGAAMNQYIKAGGFPYRKIR